MAPRLFILKAAAILSLVAGSLAANCDNAVRAAGDPSGADITAFLNSGNKLSKFCNQDFTGNTTGLISFSYLELSFKRDSGSSKTLQHCSEAFEDIIQQCITPESNDGQKGGRYGGNWSSDGETYTILDEFYPHPPTVPSSGGSSTSRPGASLSSSTHRSSQSASSQSASASSSNTHRSSQSASSESASSSSTHRSSPSASSQSASSASVSKSNSGGPTSTPPPRSSTSSEGFPTPPPSTVVITGSQGPITLGPQTSTETGSFSSTQTSIAGLTANSVTQTEVDGHHTLLPIWFIGPGLGIIMLPAAAVMPGGIVPPPPGFPPLFIGPDGSPTTGGEPEGTKDPQITSKPASQTSSSSSSSSTCSSACSNCYTYQGDGIDVPADDGGVDTKRSIAGRIELSQQYEKRAKSKDFNTFNSGGANACTLSQNLVIPNYPTPNKLARKSDAQYWYVMTETLVPGSCPVLDYNQVSDTDVTSQKINQADTVTYKKGGDWTRDSPSVNVDHVYELIILKKFFESRITAANCADFKTIFDAKDQASPDQKDTRLQTIWNQLPSNTNPDFAGMDAKINQVKGNAFTGEFPEDSLSHADQYLAYIYQMALGMKLTNDGNVAPLFKKTNVRVYEALLGMDAVIAANCASTSTITADWAESYKTWITGYLSTQSDAVTQKISEFLTDNNKLGPNKQADTITKGRQTITSTNSLGRGVSALLAAYPTPAAFTLNAGALLDFPNTRTLNVKRQACSKPQTPTASTQPPASTISAPPLTSTSAPPLTTTSAPPPTTTSTVPVTTTTAAETCAVVRGCVTIKACWAKCYCNGVLSSPSKCGM